VRKPVLQRNERKPKKVDLIEDFCKIVNSSFSKTPEKVSREKK